MCEPKMLEGAGQYPQLVVQEIEHRAGFVELYLVFILTNVSVRLPGLHLEATGIFLERSVR